MSDTSEHLEKTRRHRAQVRSLDGLRWVDGGLFAFPKDASADAARLADNYGTETRVVVQGG